MYKERFAALFEDMNSRNAKVIKLDCKGTLINYLKPFRPDTSYKLSWDLVGMLFIFVQMITIPLVITFSIDLDLFYEICNQIMDYYFLIDILVSFHTAYYHKYFVNYNRGSLITSHRKVFWHYFASWFFVDLISSFPYDMVIEISLENGSAESMKRNSQILKIVRVVRFIKILRLIRALKLKKIIHQLEDQLMLSKAFLSFLSFLRICIIILCLAHWLACIWNLVRQVEGAELNWYTRYQSYQSDNYVVYQDTNYWASQYLVAIYFSITTMITIGYGDIYPVTTWERLFGIIVIIFSSGLFGYVMNSIVAIFDSQDEVVQELLQQSENIQLYLKQKRAPKKLLARIKNYLEWLQDQEQIQKNCEQQVLENLSENLKIEILEIIHEKIIKSCLCISENFSASLQQKLVYYFKEQTFSPEDIILQNQDLENKQLFYIINGSVMIEKIQYELKNKQFFGEIGFFANIPRCSTIRATNFINLLTLNRDKFLSILQPEDTEKYFEIKFQIEIEQNLKPLNLKCYVCDEFHHIAINCPATHFVISKYDRIKVVEKFQNQAKKQRNNKKKNKSLLLLHDYKFEKAIRKIEKDMLNIEYFLNKKKQMTQYQLSQRITRDKKIKDSFISETIKEFIRFTPKSNVRTIISIVNSKADLQVRLLEEKREQERKERTKENAEKFIRMLQHKKQTQILAKQKINKSRLSIENVLKLAQTQLLRKPSSGEENRKRLLQIQEIRKKNSKSINQIESGKQIWLNFPAIPEDAIECQAQELKQFRKKLRSSHASTTVTLIEEQFNDFKAVKPRRSLSQEKQQSKPTVFYSSSCLENMIYIVINHKIFNSK